MGSSGAYFCGQLVGSVVLVLAHLAITIVSNYLPEGSTSHLVAGTLVAVAAIYHAFALSKYMKNMKEQEQMEEAEKVKEWEKAAMQGH